MTIAKILAIAALLVGGASVTLAQSGPPSGGQPAVAGRPPAAPAASGPPGPGVNPAPKIEQSAAAPTGTASGTRTATRHHKNKKMYMSAKAAPAASLAYCQTEQQVKAPCACGPAKIACPPGMYCHAFGNACTP